ncbi:hypothetical protein C8Q77DRAFT_1092801 [Trametes polyzona]|nr:hypothetical protein C8Q77DRAFT_1092801 [Trametes polyzona]
MPHRLPQELVDQAIDHLWNDRETLSACSLVCHAWLPSARTHLFRDQRLTGAKACTRFEALLESVPDVARYVRKLTINEPMSATYAQNWISRVPALVAQLHRLTTLELVGLHYVSLRNSAPETLAALSRLTALVFADVYFDSFADVHILLSAARNIRDLCFYRVSWANPSCASYKKSLPVTAPPPLRRLVIDSWASSEMLRKWLIPSAEHLGVRTLMVRWRERESIDALNGLLRACGTALESLYLELPTSIDDVEERPTLHHNTNLRTLEIDGLVVPGCVHWTSELLAGLRATHLEVLAISMLVLSIPSVSSFDWKALDEVMGQPDLAETKLSLTINLAVHSSNDPRLVKEAVEGSLPGVRERGKLLLRCA